MSEMDAKIDRAVEALGVDLLPWQRQWLRAVLSGQRVVWSRGRRGGWTTAHQVAEHVQNEERGR